MDIVLSKNGVKYAVFKISDEQSIFYTLIRMSICHFKDLDLRGRENVDYKNSYFFSMHQKLTTNFQLLKNLLLSNKNH